MTFLIESGILYWRQTIHTVDLQLCMILYILNSLRSNS